MRSAFKALFVAAPLFLAACTPWTLLRQANPNPMTAQTQFAVDNATFNNLMVGKKTEANYLAEKKPETQQSFQNDKLTFNAGFMGGIQLRAAPLAVSGPDQLAGHFVVRSNVEFLEPGNFNGFINIATEMRTKVLFTDPNGAPLDEIEIRCVVAADLFRPAVGMRVTECGRITGTYAAKYLKQRLAVK